MNVILTLLLLITVSLSAAEKRYDNPFEQSEIFGSVGENNLVSNGRGQRFAADYDDFVNGDYSMVYTSTSSTEREVGFTVTPYSRAWSVGLEWQLVMKIKTDNTTGGNWTLRIFDEKGGRAEFVMPAIIQSDWTDLKLHSSEFNPGYTRFDFSKITAFQIKLSIEKDKKIWFDDVHFIKNDNTIVGISEASVEQFYQLQQNTLDVRTNLAFLKLETWHSRNELNSYFAKLYLNREIDTTNAKLLEIFTTKNPAIQRQYGLNQLWHLSLDSILHRLYFTFGKRSKIFPGRLEKATEQALLELIWNRNIKRNDISLANQSTWWLATGESGDIISKTASLLSSQIFLNEPSYENKIYPDTGTGAGYGYWFHLTDNPAFQGLEGKGNYKEDDNYKPLEHYYAYVDYFKEYFRERAKKGILIEYGSSVYSRYTLASVYDIYSLCEDAELRELARKYLDLYWALWAQDQINGTRGGARVRDLSDPAVYSDGDYIMARFHLGGMGSAEGVGISQLLSGYKIPKAVWAMALDRNGMGDFVFTSRLPGEEENVFPKPAGNERTLMCDTKSRLLRYSYVTNDYILGTRMDHPAAVHSYISASGVRHGFMFADSKNMSAFPWAIETLGEDQWSLAKENGHFKTLQHKNTLIMQQSRQITTSSPEWYPQPNLTALPIGIYIDPSVDEVVEKDGWVFLRKANAYLAIRIIKAEISADYRGSTLLQDKDATENPYSNIDKDSYQWNREKTILKLKDIHSPIIFNAGSRKDFSNLAGFIDHILSGQVGLVKTVIPGWYILEYRTKDRQGNPTDFEFNAANSQTPAVNSEFINYSPEKLFNSPYIQSEYDSGIIKITKDEHELTLNFNE